MNSSKKSGLYFGIGMSIFYIVQNLLTSPNLTVKSVIISVVSGLIGGTVSGLVFGWIMSGMAMRRIIKVADINLRADEKVLFSTSANHFKGVEAVGGMLYLTNKRLVFRSHKFNFQNHELSMDKSNIVEVGRHKTLGLVNNGLSIKTIENKTEKFAVEEINKWIEQLDSVTPWQTSL